MVVNGSLCLLINADTWNRENFSLALGHYRHLPGSISHRTPIKLSSAMKDYNVPPSHTALSFRAKPRINVGKLSLPKRLTRIRRRAHCQRKELSAISKPSFKPRGGNNNEDNDERKKTKERGCLKISVRRNQFPIGTHRRKGITIKEEILHSCKISSGKRITSKSFSLLHRYLDTLPYIHGSS